VTLPEDPLECACFTWSYGEEESLFVGTISRILVELRLCWQETGNLLLWKLEFFARSWQTNFKGLAMSLPTARLDGA
jgi:hypothetical protein